MLTLTLLILLAILGLINTGLGQAIPQMITPSAVIFDAAGIISQIQPW